MVETEDMNPTIELGTRISRGSISQNVEELRRWEVVVFETDHSSDQSPVRLLRVAALPNETIWLDHRGLRVNGQRMAPKIPQVTYSFSTENIFAYREYITIPDEHYFLLGDNVKEATDSRHLGPIPKDQIIGRLVWE